FDEASGRTLLLPNLPAAWAGYRFRDPLADRLGVPTALINDARSFTLAESRMGAAAGCSTVVCLTIGTGVGGGVVVDGRLRLGPTAGPARAATRASTPTARPVAAATGAVSRPSRPAPPSAGWAATTAPRRCSPPRPPGPPGARGRAG